MTTRRDTSLMLAAGLGLASTRAGAQPLARSHQAVSQGVFVRELLLDGDWQVGLDRKYDRVLRTPGLATDPAKATPGTLWYKRTFVVPAGRWTNATLTLKGARFAPQVYIDGTKVSSSEGGMAATVHSFALPKGAAGKSITLEIALQSMNSLDPLDASAVPHADRWRNNMSSYIWDSVVLRLHGAAQIARVLPSHDLATDKVTLKWELAAAAPKGMTVNFKVLDQSGKALVDSGPLPAAGLRGATVLALKKAVAPWSPETPNLYLLRTELVRQGVVLDIVEQNFGHRQFAVEGLGFKLNGSPYRIRMGTIVWHRWSRDPEAKLIAFDPAWFEANVLLPIKRMGGNAMRFHLGLPPESYLDLCDRHGMAVQIEWPFFHGIDASRESMSVQYRAWFDIAARHPSVVIIHPWNETGGEPLERARAALNPLLAEYPPVVMSHRELTPVHKYWWSLFENLGLYYDSAAQFEQAVMVDEFGGNYLDGRADPGGYPTTREAFLRFLGRDHTREDRLQLHADANARVAEYWRRLDVAGFSPFTILGSNEDGSHWYLGPTDIARPAQKPVWKALAAAFAPRSVSLEIWNRSFTPGETVRMPLWFFNEGDADSLIRVSVHVVPADGGPDAVPPLTFQPEVKAHVTHKMMIDVPMPKTVGEWRIEARLEAPAAPSEHSVVSSWRIRTYTPSTPAATKAVVVGVAPEETELRGLLQRAGIKAVATSDPAAQILLGSRVTWAQLQDAAVRNRFDSQLHKGKSIVLLDAGPQPLGVGYAAGRQLGGPLEGAPEVHNPKTLQETALFGGVKVSFRETAEPESTVQQPLEDKTLWDGLPREAGWLWNGLRGGLVVPAADMLVEGLSGNALLAVWQARGADTARIKADDYFAYELAGYYAFAAAGNDRAVSDALRKRVIFLVEDAPALASAINPLAPIKTTNLHALYRDAGGQADSLTPLANAGKNLSRTPVVKLGFGPGAGRLVISQLLTAGRLDPAYSQDGPGVYGLRHDPVAEQFVLNMIKAALILPGAAS